MTEPAMPRPAGPDAPASAPDAPGEPILVWDLPVRVFHWLLAGSFAGAWLTAESERWRLLHVSLGYTMIGLLLFRVVWGLVGTRHARFADFVRGPGTVARYLGALLRGRPQHHVGHNPAGGWAILALMALGALTAATGYATYDELGGDWLEELHEGAATAMLLVVGLHIAGVVVSSRLHGENLAKAMVTGRKRGTPDQGIGSAWRSVAALLLVAVLGFWGLQSAQAPDPTGATADAATRHASRDGHHRPGGQAGRHHDDDDDDD